MKTTKANAPTKKRQEPRRRLERVPDLQRAYKATQTIGQQKPIAVDEQEHKRLTQKRTTPTLRAIAKFMASSLPLEGEDFGAQVAETERELTAMTRRAKDVGNLIALRTAYTFAHKIPKQERPDFFQSLFCCLYSQGITDNGIAYAVARADWVDWWRAYKMRSHYSLDGTVRVSQMAGKDTGDIITVAGSYGSLLVGVCDFEAQILGKVNGERLLEALPPHIRRMVQRSLEGYPLKGGDRVMLNKWVGSRPTILAQYTEEIKGRHYVK
jgi:hypothetical protein